MGVKFPLLREAFSKVVSAMAYLALFIGSIGGGFAQTVTGFGTAIVIMLFIPNFFHLIDAASISATVCIATNTILVLRYYRYAEIKKICPPLAAYLAANIFTIHNLSDLNVEHLELWFGLFLVALCLYFFLVPGDAVIRPKWYTALFCGAVSGVCGALFGIGGPLIALYLVSVSSGRLGFLGNTQVLFSVTGFVGLFARIASGVFHADLVPFILLGFCGVYIGSMIGTAVGKKIDDRMIKKVVYCFVGFSGLINIVQGL